MPRGNASEFMVDAVWLISCELAMIFGMYTMSSPTMMHMDKTDATLRTRSVPNMATMNINTPMTSVQTRYGRPVRVLKVAPPVANATAGATHMTQMYSTSKRFENTGANLP